jgi:hypothetical protein
MSQAVLPEHREDRSKIKYMKVGEEGYCTWWAIEVDMRNRIWININHTRQSKEGGTADTYIKKLPYGWFVRTHHNYEPGELNEKGKYHPVMEFV